MLKMVDTFGKIICIGFLGFFLIASYFVIQFNLATKIPCSNLRSLAKDEVLLEQLWGDIENVLRNFSSYRIANSRVGLMFAEDANNNFDIDWGLFDIPVDVASLEFYGRAVDYGRFEITQVENIKVGYGYRHYLEFKVEPYNRINDKFRYAEVIVECRE